jgi:transposase
MEISNLHSKSNKETNMFDHYIAVDWAQENMAIARMTSESGRIRTIDVPSDIEELKLYVKGLRGTTMLTFEETTPAHWLYTELKPLVTEIVVCDPYRNRLLNEGAKTDKIDAEKLVQLLRAGLLKPVFHSGEELFRLRKIVSGYDDVVRAGIRLKNQRASLFRALGLDKRGENLPHPSETFVLEGIDRGIEAYEKEKQRYEEKFKELHRKHQAIRNLESLPGVGLINATKILAIVLDARRFPDRGHFLSYCGLVQLDRVSGGKSYGKRTPRFNRALKCVFKTAAMSITIHPKGAMWGYYQYLTQEKKYQDHNARNALARRIATLAYGVLKTGKQFEQRKQCNKT